MIIKDKYNNNYFIRWIGGIHYYHQSCFIRYFGKNDIKDKKNFGKIMSYSENTKYPKNICTLFFIRCGLLYQSLTDLEISFCSKILYMSKYILHFVRNIKQNVNFSY